MIKLPRPRPKHLSNKGMTMQQFADYVCNTQTKPQILTNTQQDKSKGENNETHTR